jgi:hypothetical protein
MDHQVLFDGKDFHTLHHPGEDAAMKKLGFDETEALRNGRVFYDLYCVCLDCRSITTRRKLRGPDFFSFRLRKTWIDRYWWIVVIPLGIIAGIRDWPLWIILPPIVITYVAADAILNVLWKRKTRRRAADDAVTAQALGAAHEHSRCAHCGSERLQVYFDVIYAARQTGGEADLRCPKCGELTLHDDRHYMAMA